MISILRFYDSLQLPLNFNIIDNKTLLKIPIRRVFQNVPQNHWLDTTPCKDITIGDLLVFDDDLGHYRKKKHSEHTKHKNFLLQLNEDLKLKKIEHFTPLIKGRMEPHNNESQTIDSMNYIDDASKKNILAK